MNWQPISTAPHDTWILLYRPDSHSWSRVDIGRWDENRHSNRPRPFWRSMHGLLGITEMRNHPPSHWMPLPPPPTDESTNG